MSLNTIEQNIQRLIILRRDADAKTQKAINVQLNKLYEFKYLILGGLNGK